MLKKLTAVLLICLTLLAVLPGLLSARQDSLAEPAGQAARSYDLDGMIISVEDGSFLMRSSEGVIFQVSAVGMTEGLLAGDAVRLRYNGMMTRSIPSQISAQVILSRREQAVVTEVTDTGLTLQTEDGDTVTAMTSVQAQPGDEVTVWLTDETVLLVRGTTVSGMVSGIDGSTILLDTEGGTVAVRSAETTVVLTEPEVGQPLTAACDRGPDEDGSYTATLLYTVQAAEEAPSTDS